MAAETQRVQVAPGRAIYRGPSPHPFRAGAELDLPTAHATALLAAGHVRVAAPAAPAQQPAAAAAAPAPHAA